MQRIKSCPTSTAGESDRLRSQNLRLGSFNVPTQPSSEPESHQQGTMVNRRSVAPPDQPQCASAEGSRPRMYSKETYRTAAPTPPALGPARGRSGRSVGAPEGLWRVRTPPRRGSRRTASAWRTVERLGLTAGVAARTQKPCTRSRPRKEANTVPRRPGWNQLVAWRPRLLSWGGSMRQHRLGPMWQRPTPL